MNLNDAASGDINQYSMEEGLKVSKQAIADVTAYLMGSAATIHVIDVTGDDYFRGKGVNLLIHKYRDGKPVLVKARVIGDSWAGSKNFFFEVCSNEQKGTPGTVLISEADYLMYYFVNSGQLYAIPLPELRNWFLKNSDKFPLRRVSTGGRGGEPVYTTTGKLVPIALVMNEVPGCKARDIAVKGR